MHVSNILQVKGVGIEYDSEKSYIAQVWCQELIKKVRDHDQLHNDDFPRIAYIHMI